MYHQIKKISKMVFQKKLASCCSIKCLPGIFLIFVLFVFLGGGNNLAFANTSTATNISVETKLQEHVFTVNKNTTKDKLREIEAYFTKTHPNLLVKFDNVQTDASGKVLSFALKLKFKGESKFNTRLIKTGDEKNMPVFRLQYVKKGPALKIQQSGTRNVTLLVTKDNMQTVE